MINAYYYDIESLDNVFTNALFWGMNGEVYVFFLVDMGGEASLFGMDAPPVVRVPYGQKTGHTTFDECAARVWSKNRNFNGAVTFLNLSAPGCALVMAGLFGGLDPMIDKSLLYEVCTPGYTYKEFISDTMPGYDAEHHPYFCGYNSYNYDTTMLARFMDLFFRIDYGDPSNTAGRYVFQGANVTAKLLRDFSDLLFSAEFRDKMPSALCSYYDASAGKYVRDYSMSGKAIRDRMICSGRHLDVSRLNEKQGRVALKRLLGLTGRQILESDKLKATTNHIQTLDELNDLIAYNVSDVVNLRELMHHPLYISTFELKKSLLQEYPDLVYEKKETSYSPDIRPEAVATNRQRIDSSSSQLSSHILCPYGRLEDIRHVSFMYPSSETAVKYGIKPSNVLDDAVGFFRSMFPADNPKYSGANAMFDRVVSFYRMIEGKNYNESTEYRLRHPTEPIWSLPGKKNYYESATGDRKAVFMPYFYADGKPTSCYVVFSTGGIHGAEYNKKLYEEDFAKYKEELEIRENVKEKVRKLIIKDNPDKSPDEVSDDMIALRLRLEKSVVLDGGKTARWGDHIRKVRNEERFEWEKIKKPILINETEQSIKKEYTYTSACVAEHEDFTSYYPILLTRMGAFSNAGLGQDRYAEIFRKKEEYGRLMRDAELTKEEQNRYKVLREGTKLVLNSASGAGDAPFDNPIRMNNRIISMRIIGQLFTWMIGQAQAYEGARIVSTNTDGLYSAGLAVDKNNAILAREAEKIHVDIKPDTCYIISKDSNNRLELHPKTGEIIAASGGKLACWQGPTPAKSLSHPAILHRVLAEYLVWASKAEKLYDDYDLEKGLEILRKVRREESRLNQLLLFQNVLASSPGSHTYIYGISQSGCVRILQKFNRVFLVLDEGKDTLQIKAATAKDITDAMRRKRAPGQVVREEIALYVLKENGEDENAFYDRDIVTKKVPLVGENDRYVIDNGAIYLYTDEEADRILERLDLEGYNRKVADVFNKNWKNT